MISLKLLAFLLSMFSLIANYNTCGMEKRIALRDAVQKGDLEAAQKALDTGADQNASLRFTHNSSTFYATALEAAVRFGDLPMVKLLVSRGGSLKNSQILKMAVGAENIKLVQWLIENGVDVNLDTPIFSAMALGNMEIVRLLMNAGAHISGAQNNIIGILLSALLINDKTTYFIKLALENGYDINAPVYKFLEKTPIQLLIENPYREKVKLIRWLLEHGAQLTNAAKIALRNQGIVNVYNNPMLDAIAFHDVKGALRLLKNYGKISEGSPEVKVIRQAFILAAAQGLHELVVKMLNDYDEILPISLIGEALERAAMNRHSFVVEAIYDFYRGHIQHNAVVWRPYLSRALLLAAVQRRKAVVEFLLTQDFLYNLGLSIDQVGKRIRELLANTALRENVRKELEELQDLLARHQQARQAGQVIAGSQQPLYSGQIGSAFEVLPPEAIQYILGYVRLPGSSQ